MFRAIFYKFIIFIFITFNSDAFIISFQNTKIKNKNYNHKLNQKLNHKMNHKINHKMNHNSINYENLKSYDYNPYKSVSDFSYSPITIQGGSLKTWSYKSHNIEKIQVKITSEGRPLDSEIELWQGPQNVPCKIRLYVENGQLRPFHLIMETQNFPNTLAIKNIGQVEFPIKANVNTFNTINPSSKRSFDKWKLIKPAEPFINIFFIIK